MSRRPYARNNSGAGGGQKQHEYCTREHMFGILKSLSFLPGTSRFFYDGEWQLTKPRNSLKTVSFQSQTWHGNVWLSLIKMSCSWHDYIVRNCKKFPSAGGDKNTLKHNEKIHEEDGGNSWHDNTQWSITWFCVRSQTKTSTGWGLHWCGIMGNSWAFLTKTIIQI